MYAKTSAVVDGSAMEILVFEPEGDGPFPGIVVAQHLPIAHAGLEKDPFTIDVGERLARAGFACVIPYIFHWWPPDEDIDVKRAEFRDDWTVADMAATYDVLAGMARVDGDRIGIIGHCWGAVWHGWPYATTQATRSRLYFMADVSKSLWGPALSRRASLPTAFPVQ